MSNRKSNRYPVFIAAAVLIALIGSVTMAGNVVAVVAQAPTQLPSVDDLGNVTLTGTATALGAPLGDVYVTATASGPDGVSSGSSSSNQSGNFSITLHLHVSDTVTVTATPRTDWNSQTIVRSGTDTYYTPVFNFAFSGPTSTPVPSAVPTRAMTPIPVTLTPVIKITGICDSVVGLITFNVRNQGASMTAPGTWTMTENGQVIGSGQFTLMTGQVLPLLHGAGTITLTITNVPGAPISSVVTCSAA